jgi:hypothetical protein
VDSYFLTDNVLALNFFGKKNEVKLYVVYISPDFTHCGGWKIKDDGFLT